MKKKKNTKQVREEQSDGVEYKKEIILFDFE